LRAINVDGVDDIGNAGITLLAQRLGCQLRQLSFDGQDVVSETVLTIASCCKNLHELVYDACARSLGAAPIAAGQGIRKRCPGGR